MYFMITSDCMYLGLTHYQDETRRALFYQDKTEHSIITLAACGGGGWFTIPVKIRLLIKFISCIGSSRI